MVEYDPSHLPLYQKMRPNSIHLIQDATTIDFAQQLRTHGAPANMDYLQVDLEVDLRSTLTTLENLDRTVFGEYKFATVTFEHDIYRGDFFGTRAASREIFERHGYFRLFSDIRDGSCAYEDWYVHPDLVDMERVRAIAARAGAGSIAWQSAIAICREEMSV